LIWIKAPTRLPCLAFPSKAQAEMPHVCAFIIAMQLTCVVDKEIVCTDNEYLAQLVNTSSCERVFFHQDGANVSPKLGRLLN
jgi:hypothetical protein